jgi:hypothetical protein
MVKLPGFPRPLYPPDAEAHGKQASIDGPDVIAYKRTVWRAGRWQGPASNFDEAYSDRFALGAGPNVVDTGVAGVQRQQDIDDTGWIGTKTFNTLRSIRVPEGPHAGEMAMDDYAVELLVQAWKRFGGHEPDSGSKGSVRERALWIACDELGTKESPPESNNVKYCDWYGMVGPWCAMFVTWCFERAADELGTDSLPFIQGGRYAYVPYLIADARAAKYGLSVTDDPIAGDLVCYDWDGGEYDHVGIFEQWNSGSSFDAIEGNTSTSNDSNGGQVMRRMRDRKAQGTTFIRVKEPDA